MTMIDKGTAEQAIEWALTVEQPAHGVEAAHIFLADFRSAQPGYIEKVYPNYLTWVGAQPTPSEPTDSARVEEVDFYEREFYPLSNFSSFAIMWPLSERQGLGRFDTSEALYHWLKFSGQANPKRVATADQNTIASAIRAAPSAHEAFKIAERHKSHRRRDWDEIKVDTMRRIIRAKAEQHEYVRRKLMETGDRPLVEGSWRDDFWGIGPNRDGHNMLGKLWMELRSALIDAEMEKGR